MYKKTASIRMTLAILIASFLIADAVAQNTLRIATFNVSLYGKQPGQIFQRLSGRGDLQAKRIASIVQTVRPDILLVNELDYQPDSAPAKLLAENYFAVAQDSATGDEQLTPIDYPYFFSAPSNTGIDSALDLNRDGKLGSGNDAWGYGIYPGQYAMTVYSRYPIDSASIRTFQELLWKQLPGAIRPRTPATGQPYYDDATWAKLRLSSKNHIDVPIHVGDRVIHVLASHPTPPVFDGPEDRNGARNHDEIQFWNHYLDADESAPGWLIDDDGRVGALNVDASFVVMGDLNADPIDGGGRRESIIRLLSHPRVRDVHQSKTADFGRNGPMRVDYVLPSSDLDVVNSGVFWPTEDDPQSTWIKASDHRLVWIEVKR